MELVPSQQHPEARQNPIHHLNALLQQGQITYLIWTKLNEPFDSDKASFSLLLHMESVILNNPVNYAQH